MKRPLILVCGVVCCTVSFSTLLYATNRSASTATTNMTPTTNTTSTTNMTRQIIRIPNAPSSPLYSQAVKVGSTIYVTGIVGIDPATNRVSGSTIQEQTRQALLNCSNILSAAGATLANVVEVQVLLARPDDFAGLNEEYAKFFRVDPPIRSVARLGPELPNILVSIKMTAVLEN